MRCRNERGKEREKTNRRKKRTCKSYKSREGGSFFLLRRLASLLPSYFSLLPSRDLLHTMVGSHPLFTSPWVNERLIASWRCLYTVRHNSFSRKLLEPSLYTAAKSPRVYIHCYMFTHHIRCWTVRIGYYCVPASQTRKRKETAVAVDAIQSRLFFFFESKWDSCFPSLFMDPILERENMVIG